MSERDVVDDVTEAVCSEMRGQHDDGCWVHTLHNVCANYGDANACDCTRKSHGIARAALSAARPRWVRLPDTRPTEWPWEGMMPEDEVAVFHSEGYLVKLRLACCWWGDGDDRVVSLTHVAPWSDIAELLPEANNGE